MTDEHDKSKTMSSSLKLRAKVAERQVRPYWWKNDDVCQGKLTVQVRYLQFPLFEITSLNRKSHL